MSAVDRTDEQLVEAWRGGDPRAGAALVDRHYDSIARFFVHRLGSDSEDLVQETFIGLQGALERFRGECSVRIYLFKIARNQLLTAIRKRVRHREHIDPGEHSLADLDPTPSQLINKNDEQKLLVAALRSLPINTQMMLELHYWEKLKMAEIGEVLDMKEGTVRVNMHRGRKLLFTKMSELAQSEQVLRTSLHRLSSWVAQLREELGDDAPSSI